MQPVGTCNCLYMALLAANTVLIVGVVVGVVVAIVLVVLIVVVLYHEKKENRYERGCK